VTLSVGLSRARAWLGHAYAVAGHTERARQTLVDLEKLTATLPVSPYDIALIHAALGDRERTFMWLERAYQARAWDLVQIKVDVRLDGVRSDPRFDALLKRIGLPSAAEDDQRP
jgi:hypothetical protein